MSQRRDMSPAPVVCLSSGFEVGCVWCGLPGLGGFIIVCYVMLCSSRESLVVCVYTAREEYALACVS